MMVTMVTVKNNSDRKVKLKLIGWTAGTNVHEFPSLIDQVNLVFIFKW